MNKIKKIIFKAIQHKSTAAIICLGLIGLLLAACAVQKENTAGRINGVYINEQDFLTSLRGHFTGFVLEKDRTPGDAEKKELYQKTWQDITKHVVLKEYFKKYHIQVTQQEVLDTLANNIPPSIMNAPIFQTQGTFNKTLYLSVLTSPQNNQLDWLKKYYYEYYIPIAKLKLELQKDDIIGKKELNELYTVLNTEADIDWIIFDPARTQVQVSQAEVENYYRTHINDYKIKRYAEFGWTELPVKLTEEDIENTKTRIDSIYYQLINGKPFAMMVEAFSQTVSAKNKGELGFVREDELSPAVRAALQSVEINGYTRPMKIDNYWVIYQLAERTKNLVKIKELALEIVPGEKNKNQVKETAIHLRDLALQLGLETAADEMDLPYRTSGIVNADSVWMKDKDLCAYLIDRAYTQTQGAVLEPVYSKQLQIWVVAQVLQVQPHETKDLIEVEEQIREQLVISKRKAQTLEAATSWAQEHKKDQLRFATKDNLPVISTKPINVKDTVQNESISAIFPDIIRSELKKNPQKPYLLNDIVVLPVVSACRPLNPPLITTEQVRQYYFQNINPDWFDQWLDEKVKQAKVEIWYKY